MTDLTTYIVDRLLNARSTSFTDGNNNTQYNCTDDMQPRCSKSHTLSNNQVYYQNYIQEHMKVEDQIGYCLVEFYRNTLAAGEPLTANMIICNTSLDVPYPFLKRIDWAHESYFIFNEKTGLLSDKWHHIFGCFPS